MVTGLICRPDKRSAIRQNIPPDGGINALSGLRLYDFYCFYFKDNQMVTGPIL